MEILCVKMKRVIYIIGLFVLVGCQNELSVRVPEAQPVNMLELNAEAAAYTSVAAIGKFSGPLNIRTTYILENDEVAKTYKGNMAVVDAQTFGAYFELPPRFDPKGFNIYLWIRKESYLETLFLDKIQISSPKGSRTIDKSEFEALFELVNLSFDANTGEFRPIKKNPIPRLTTKFTLDEMLGHRSDSVSLDSINLPISPISTEIPNPDTSGSR